MTSKERVKRAIYFQKPDRIPHYLPDDVPDDILWAAPWTMGTRTRPADIQSWTNTGDIDQRIDTWGVTWERPAGKDGNMGQAKQYPVQNIEHQANYRFPDINNKIYYSNYQQAITRNANQDNPKYVLGVLGFSSLNEGIHNIMGLEKMFMSYYEYPDHLKALISRFAKKQGESIRLLSGLGCDGIMAYDDWGLQDRLMIKLDLIEEFFLPHYRKNWSLAHQLGMDVWMHSCGYIIDLLPNMIDAGLNVIQMDQQQNMGLENLARTVGGKIAFWCPVDIQNVMINGTIQDIETYIKKMINTLGGFNGGLISMSYTTPDAINISPEKIDAMCRAFRKYGIYY